VTLLLFEGEKNNGSASKHAAVIADLIFTDSSSLRQLAELQKRARHVGLYKAIENALATALHEKQVTNDCINKLAFVADQAYAIRQFDVVGSVGQLLLEIPASHQGAGHYYRAINLNHKSLEDVAVAGCLFEQVADDSRSQYRHRAILALGTNFVRDGDHRAAMSLYRETLRLMTRDRIFDPATLYFANRMAAVIKGLEGDHEGAVADLERLFPFARMASSLQPYAYYDYLNAFAVELGEVERVDQARRVSEIAIASPFAPAYPEWHETFDVIEYKQRRASRSIVAVPKQVERTSDAILQKIPDLSSDRSVPQSSEVRRQNFKRSGNLVLLPVTERRVDSTREKEKGRVLSFRKWKMASQKPCHLQPEKLTPEQRESLTTPQKLVRIIDLISRDETDDEAIDRILDAVEEIALGSPEDQVG
jgi:tetratricopeptide (TPR) repeat protein